MSRCLFECVHLVDIHRAFVHKQVDDGRLVVGNWNIYRVIKQDGIPASVIKVCPLGVASFKSIGGRCARAMAKAR